MTEVYYHNMPLVPAAKEVSTEPSGDEQQGCTLHLCIGPRALFHTSLL